MAKEKIGKAEIVKALISEGGFTVDQASLIYETFLDAIEAGLIEGKTIHLRKCFKAWTERRPARKLYSPLTKQHYNVGPRAQLKIKPLFDACKHGPL